MADFVDEEADVSSGSGSESGSEDDNQRPKSQGKRAIIDSSEEGMWDRDNCVGSGESVSFVMIHVVYFCI